MGKSRKTEPRCSFCGGTSEDGVPMVSGPDGLMICASCIELCNMIINRGANANPGEHRAEYDEVLDVPKPAELKAHLDQYVIGQDEVKKVLSVAVHNHYKRLNYLRDSSHKGDDTLELDKSNILMIGPTGCGKTLLAKTLAKKLDVPFAIADATTLTEAGYVGEDVENILLRLVQAANYDLKKAEIGIVFVDEIDKVARKTQNVSITRDVSGEGVQQALLKILESTIANIPPKGGRKHPDQEYLKLDTSNILFICAGAFVGLDKIIHRRIGKRVVGFTQDGKSNVEIIDEKDSALLNNVQPEDLLEFGLIPEFVGRLPVLTSLKPLEKMDLIHILTQTKNCLVKQYQMMMRMDGIELEFSEDALDAIAEEAMTRGTGARGLRAIMEKLMLEIMYEVPSVEGAEKCVVTAETVHSSGKVTTIYANGKKISGRKRKKNEL